jgi:hypothetical protein
MKFRITFEVDAAGTSYSLKNKNDEVSAVVENLNHWIATLEKHFLAQKVETMFDHKDDPKRLKAMLKNIDDDLKLAKQIFNNFSIKGTMENGEKFTFSSQNRRGKIKYHKKTF